MNNSLIPRYYQMLEDLKQRRAHKILCSELFDRYNSLFLDNHTIFENALEYLEQHGEIRIERIDAGDVFPYSVEVIY